VQPSTLIRFAKEFGYEGFSRMQQVFKTRLIEGAPDWRERVYDARAESGSDDMLDRASDGMISALQRLKRETRREDLARAVDILQDADFAWVAGLRRARPIAAYMAYGLNRLERRAALLDFDGGMAAQQVANMRRGDVLTAIAFPEYSPPVVEAVRDAHLRGIPVIALTDSAASPLAKNADAAFYVDDASPGAFRPIGAAIGLVQAMVEILAARGTE
jgi:DNA-binding MurR/RpiR family transcriptional regulator